MALFIIGSYAAKPHIPVYGAEWDGSSNPAWTRTDDAVGFADPNPYYSEMSGTPSSPFDDIMPWSGMRIVEDSSAGILVEIPKFYYKWTRNGNAMKLQISMTQEAEFLCSPAHADRGDGVGERDYVYVGRYHCTGSYKSEVASPLTATSRTSFRTNIHNLGSNVWQNDFAMRWTVNMLYLVEFAHWNSQEKIGYGSDETSGGYYPGQVSTMPYHTGTIGTSRTSFAKGVQYRYIADWWSNIADWCDGVRFSGSSFYCEKNPSNFSESGGTYVSSRLTSGGYINKWSNPSVEGFEYALIPSTVGSTINYDYYAVPDSSYTGVLTGIIPSAASRPSLLSGAFAISSMKYSSVDYRVGSRLMVLPPSRLTA